MFFQESIKTIQSVDIYLIKNNSYRSKVILQIALKVTDISYSETSEGRQIFSRYSKISSSF